jgi:hypothetical protein
VCPRCCGIGHRSFKACGDRPPKCLICAGPHEGLNHTCNVVNCVSKPGKACQHMPARCGNCGGNHPATAANCPTKRQARKELSKTKSQDASIPSSSSFAILTPNRLRSNSKSRSPLPDTATTPQMAATDNRPTTPRDTNMGDMQTPRPQAGRASSNIC